MWVTNYFQTRFCFTVRVLWVTILSIQWYRFCLGVHLLKDLHWKSCGWCWRSSLGWRPCVWYNLGLGSLICLEPWWKALQVNTREEVNASASVKWWQDEIFNLQQLELTSLATLKGSMSSSANKLPSVKCGGLDLFSLVLLHSLSLPVQFLILAVLSFAFILRVASCGT